ncbi:MAG: hypothetical protein ACREA0_23025, partial [bacterium]
LDPLLRLANYVLESVGQEELGSKTAWALDRVLPAYRVMWSPEGVLFLRREDGVFEFGPQSDSRHPVIRSGVGLAQVVRSYLGFHPYAKDHLVLTLVNPPRGGGVAKNIRKIAESVKSLRVYVVSTSGDATQLEEVGDPVRNLGRFPDLEAWKKRAPVRSHLLFYFSPARPGSAAAALHGWGPTPGAYVAPKVNVRPAGAFQASRLVPYVTFEPRKSNRPVVAVQQLSKANKETPKLFEVQPMLSDDEMSRFSNIAQESDWAILCAPAPLGLVPGKSGSEDLTYVGRDSMGGYGLFVFATSMFSIRKLVTGLLGDIPVLPNPEEVEKRLTELASESAKGVLRIGRTQGGALWEHVGLIVGGALGRNVDG